MSVDSPTSRTSQRMDTEVRQQIIDMYQNDRPVREIEAATGIPRSTIYYTLKTQDIRPGRYRNPDQEELQQAYDRIAELEARVSEVLQRAKRAESMVDYLILKGSDQPDSPADEEIIG